MYFNRETDYCIRIIQCLCLNDGRIGAGAISEETGVTQRFALKILLKLVGKGLVRSYKGVKGGYELAKRPEEITLFDVIETIDGNIAISQCLHQGYECERAGGCFFHHFFGELSEDIKNRLKSVNFEMIKNEVIQ